MSGDFGLIDERTMRRFLRNADLFEQMLNGEFAPPLTTTTTTRSNIRQGVWLENLAAPDSVTDDPTSATFQIYAPDAKTPGSALAELEGSTYELTVYNHDPNFTADKDDYGRVRKIGTEFQPLSGGGSDATTYFVIGDVACNECNEYNGEKHVEIGVDYVIPPCKEPPAIEDSKITAIDILGILTAGGSYLGRKAVAAYGSPYPVAYECDEKQWYLLYVEEPIECPDLPDDAVGC